MSKRARVGVFDSGVGGLTVVRALREQRPGDSIVYLGDTARVPYGSKSPRTVERYARACQHFLLEHEVELIVVACNTVSATALPALVKASPVPVLGAVLPGAEVAVAATRNRRIGVIATLATVSSGAYEKIIRAALPGAQVTTLPCPLFVPLAEEGWTEGAIADAVAERYLAALFAKDAEIDTLVLGCTHYPLLAATIGEVALRHSTGEVQIVDSALAMARAATEILYKSNSPTGEGRLSIYATDRGHLAELAPRFLGAPVDSFTLVDL